MWSREKSYGVNEIFGQNFDREKMDSEKGTFLKVYRGKLKGALEFGSNGRGNGMKEGLKKFNVKVEIGKLVDLRLENWKGCKMKNIRDREKRIEAT